MNIPFGDDFRARSCAISLSPILISETTDDDRLYNSTSKVRIDDFDLAMFEPPPLDSYKKNSAKASNGCYSGGDKKNIEPAQDLSSASDISESETSHYEFERIATPIRVRAANDDHLQDSASKLQLDDLDQTMFEPPPLEAYKQEHTKENLDHTSRARIVSFDTLDVLKSELPHFEWERVTEPALTRPVMTDNLYPFLHLEANDPKTSWTIQVLDNGDVPAGKKGLHDHDSVWFRVYFQPEKDFVYYQGQEIIDCVRDLLEFHGRSVFQLQRMSNEILEIVRASEIVCKLQELILTSKC